MSPNSPPSPYIRTSHIADACDRLGLGLCCGAGLPLWLGPDDATIIAPAYTLQQRAVTGPGDTPRPLRHAEAAASLVPPGHLLVMDVAGDTQGASWGEAHTLRAWKRGVAGVLLNGRTRDLAGLRAHQFPVLCQGATPLRSTGRLETLAIECEVVICGVAIRHGDTLAMDADGFVRIPADRVDEVMAMARDIAQQEQERDRKLADFKPGKPTNPSKPSAQEA